jgi:catechol 2,3-dioxygenase-like lactoylglutathione lyase family enzyme
MNILGIDHAALLVQDVERSRRFYCEVLGMQEVFSGGNCWLRRGGAEIHLIGQPEGQPVRLNYRVEDIADGSATHIAFELDNLEEAQRHFENLSIPIVCGPRLRWDAGEQLYICDPDGYLIELFMRKK